MAFLLANGYTYLQARRHPVVKAAMEQYEQGTYERPTSYYHIDGIVPNPRSVPYMAPVSVENATPWPSYPGFLSDDEVNRRLINSRRARADRQEHQAPPQPIHGGGGGGEHPTPPPYNGQPPADNADSGGGIIVHTSATTAVFYPTLDALIDAPPFDDHRRGRGPVHVILPFNDEMCEYLKNHHEELFGNTDLLQALGDIFIVYTEFPPPLGMVDDYAEVLIPVMEEAGLLVHREARAFAKWVLKHWILVKWADREGLTLPNN